MADFCAQCAKDLGFEKTDFPHRDPPPEDMGYPEICEGCGHTLVDGDGKCVWWNCIRSHGEKPDGQV